jgi:Ca2+-binding EF-hand superfamily protein
MDLTFNVLESIRRDIRELRDDLTIEKDARIKSCDDLKKELKEVRRDVRYLKADLVAERDARQAAMEELRREFLEELRREVGQVHAAIDVQRKRIRVSEEEGFMILDGACVSWGLTDVPPGTAPAAVDVEYPRNYRVPPAVFTTSKDHCSFVIGTGDNGHSRIRKDGFTASALSFAGVDATRGGCQMNWMAVGPRVVDTERNAADIGVWGGPVPRLETMTTEEKMTLFTNLFRQADVNASGSLDSGEFLQLLRACNLNLSRSAVRRIMEEADINDDGMVQFEEFVPVMVDIIQSVQALEEGAVLKEEEDQEAWDTARKYIMEGMTPEELEEAALQIFMAYDTDNSGTLERGEFLECVRAMDMGMTRKEILYIMAQADKNQDGVISYEEFLPVAIDQLVTTAHDKLVDRGSGQRTRVLTDHFTRKFVAADQGLSGVATGKLKATEIRSILSASSLSGTQVEIIMAEAHIGGDGMIAYSKFARICAVMAGDLWGGMPPQEKGYNAMTADEMAVYLQQLYQSADTDNSGLLDETEMVALLGKSGLGMSARAVRRVMEEADTNDDGSIDYNEFVPLMANLFDTMKVTNEAVASQEAEYAAATAATEQLFESKPAGEIDAKIRDMFKAADANGNGELDRTEFMEAMRQLNFGLSKKEIKSLMAHIDKNQDGKINYEEFVPLARDVLAEYIKEKYLEGSGRLAHLCKFFLELFAEADSTHSGFLPINTIRELLVESGWSTLQTETVLMDAVLDPHGNIDYKKFVRIAAECASGFTSGLAPSAMQKEVRASRLVGLFRRIDVDSSGRISTTELESYIKRLAAKFRNIMSKQEVEQAVAVFKGAPVDEDTFVEYFLDVYSEIEDEIFVAFLDFCDTASYGARSRRLRTLFWKLDTDGSGVLETFELKDYIRKLAAKFEMEIREEDMNYAVAEYQFVDKNGDGRITEDEFITVLLEMFDNVSDEIFVSAIDEFDVYSEGDRVVIFTNMFKRHDLDHDGFLDSFEVREYFKKFALKLGKGVTEADLDSMVNEFQLVDANGDGKVSQQEFIDYFMRETGDMSDGEFYAQLEFFDS